VLLAASGLLWAVMFFGPLAELSRLAGGAAPFDIRPAGYSFAEAQAFLAAIGSEGRRYYAFPELALDTLYPPLYALSRGLALWWLTMPGRVRERPLAPGLRRALVAVPIAMATLDLIENSCIAIMLSTWPDLSAHIVQASSLATRAKIVLGGLTEVLMAILAILWLARQALQWRAKRRT
jgi:hypothetical protein